MRKRGKKRAPLKTRVYLPICTYASGGRLRGFLNRSGVSVFRAWRAVHVAGTQPWSKRFGPTIADGTVMYCVACVHLEELDDDMWRFAPGSVGEMRRGSCFCAFPVDGRAIVTGLMLAGRSNTWCDLRECLGTCFTCSRLWLVSRTLQQFIHIFRH